MTSEIERREAAVREYYTNEQSWFDTAPTVKGLDWKLIDDWNAVTPEKTVLDIGPHFPSDALRWGPRSKSYLCIDLLPEVCKLGRAMTEHIEQVKWMCVNACSRYWPVEDHFDTVLSMSSIDHIPRIEDRIRAHCEAARVLKPGGLMILMSSNRLYKRDNVNENPAEVDMFGYERWHYLHELIDEVAPSGLKIVHYETGGHYSMPRVGSVWRKA